MSRGLMRLVAVLAALGAGWYAFRPSSGEPVAPPQDHDAAPIRSTFTRSDSGTMQRVSGRVERLLADDNDGSRHQRFIIETDAGTTLLIAHNIDLAPRLEGLAAGDSVEVSGEYEWNERGGLMHWTHKDPQGDHAAGYIQWQGRRYQ